MVKFLTLADARSPDGCLSPDLVTLAFFGGFFRATNAAELPEPWNVLCGEMSLVEPHQLLMGCLAPRILEQSRYHKVRPGITKRPRVNGRNALNCEDKPNLDVRYVDSRSFWTTIDLLWLTMKSVIVRDGLYTVGEGTMHGVKVNDGKKFSNLSK
jgi:lipopolysaccharide/colanic/teichoic acid biosynthesis glycosyltransferase